MPIIKLRHLGEIGVNSDLSRETLPPNAFTSAENMTFRDGTPYKALGEVGNAFGTPAVAPYGIFPAQGPSDFTWIMAGLGKVYSYFNGSLTDMTNVGGDYTATESTPWTGGWLNGVSLLNNANDTPQFVGTITGSSKLADLTNWPASTTTNVMRVFKNYAIAMDVTKSGTRYPTLFKWSHPADPGAVPPSWDETDNSFLAGEFPISATPGRIVDGLTMKNSFIVYKTDGIIAVRETFDVDTIFRFDPISLKFGIPGINCVSEFKPGLHAFMSQTADLMINNGQSVYSISTNRVKKRIEALMNAAQISRSFVVTDVRNKEVLFCFPSGVSNWPDYAITWNWENNTFGEKSFPQISMMAEGKYNLVASSPDVWDDLSSTPWGNIDSTWDGVTANLTSNRILGVSPIDTDVYLLSEGYSADGGDKTSSVERRTIPLAGQDEKGNITLDPKLVKLVKRVFPIIEAQDGTIFRIQIGAQDSISSSITWQGPFDFDPSKDIFLEFFIEGRYISYRVENISQVPWRLIGFDIDLHLNGEYF